MLTLRVRTTRQAYSAEVNVGYEDPGAFPSMDSGQDWTDLFEQPHFYLTLKNIEA